MSSSIESLLIGTVKGTLLLIKFSFAGWGCCEQTHKHEILHFSSHSCARHVSPDREIRTGLLVCSNQIKQERLNVGGKIVVSLCRNSLLAVAGRFQFVELLEVASSRYRYLKSRATEQDLLAVSRHRFALPHHSSGESRSNLGCWRMYSSKRLIMLLHWSSFRASFRTFTGVTCSETVQICFLASREGKHEPWKFFDAKQRSW